MQRILTRNRNCLSCANRTVRSYRRNYASLEKLEIASPTAFSENKIRSASRVGPTINRRRNNLSSFHLSYPSLQRRFYGEILSDASGLPHDLGGSLEYVLGSFPINTAEGELQVWEKECHALLAVLGSSLIKFKFQIQFCKFKCFKINYSSYSMQQNFNEFRSK